MRCHKLKRDRKVLQFLLRADLAFACYWGCQVKKELGPVHMEVGDPR